jgi:hypothetical protein
MKTRWQELLDGAVRQGHSRFLRGFGFELREEDPDTFVAQSRCCLIRIGLDRHSVAIDVAPLSGRDVPKYEEIALVWLLDALAPKPLTRDEFVNFGLLRFPEQLKDEVGRQLGLLVQYCRPVLLGDMQYWERVERRMDLMKNAPPVARPELTPEQRIARLHRVAREAYDRADYVYAFTCYNVLEADGEITDEERRLYEEARRWLEAAGRDA